MAPKKDQKEKVVETSKSSPHLTDNKNNDEVIFTVSDQKNVVDDKDKQNKTTSDSVTELTPIQLKCIQDLFTVLPPSFFKHAP